MKRCRITHKIYKLGLLVLLGCFSGGLIHAEDLHIKCIVVWATNDETSKYKEISPELEKKLLVAPYKWKHYYEVHKTNTVLAPKQTKKLKMSEHCLLEATNPNDGRIQVNLVGEGKPVSKNVEPLKVGQTVAFSGDAKNDAGWFVMIHRYDPKAKQDSKGENGKDVKSDADVKAEHAK
ncbi:MAG: hypothetical protein JWQ71_497 [Pedosphaera sp.]|nr:hypothetical protein [Pedosphaera sp.]